VLPPSRGRRAARVRRAGSSSKQTDRLAGRGVMHARCRST
jgi:hypothetical protein